MHAKYIEIDHPGIILKEEFLDPLNLTQSRLARVTGIPKGRISEIIHGKRDVTAETGIRISRALGLSDGYFYGLQTDYNSRKAQQKLDKLGVEVISLVS
ncbi:MAG: HigA family addiction module antidote protein [Rhodothermaceae bacterium]|nr:HigA family addiction module antidote protein [Rhodothermaceae bacterium]